MSAAVGGLKTSARRPVRSRVRVSHTIGRLILYVVLYGGAITMALPFLWMLSTSLKALPDVFKWPPQFLPNPPLWENYAKVFTLVPFGHYFLNTVFVSAARVLGVVITSALAGYAFARLRFPGRDVLFFLYLGTMMVPGQVTMIPNFIIMRYLHWIDTYYALIIPQIFSAFGTFLMRQYFLSLPPALEEAAVIDGCNPWGVFRRIALPLATPALATLSIFTLLGSWNDFMWPLIMTNSPKLRVLSVGLSSFQETYITNWPLLMAGAVMALLPVLVAYLFAQRYFVQGIALSGIKG
jgi:multiple sugar transport system permease protein